MRFSKFHDHPATAIVASKKQPAQSSSTATPSRISVGRRKANHSEAITRITIGPTTCHILDRTRFNVALPSNSQPERNAWFFGQPGGQGGERAGFDAVRRGIDQAHHHHWSGVLATNRFSSHRLTWLVGQTPRAASGARPGLHQFPGQKSWRWC